MDIIFEKIQYSNIMTVGSNPIEIDLDSHKKTLIVGGNGTSKSTIIEALNFALYGTPYRNIKRNQLVNSINKAKMQVDLAMKIGDKSVHVTRGIKPNIFEIYVDGELLPMAPSVREYQQELESIIQLNDVVYKQQVVLGTAGFKPFMTLTAGERKSSVENMIGLTIIGEMDKVNKEIIRELNQSIKVGEMKVDHLEQQIKSNLSFIKKQEEDVEKNKEHYKDTIDNVKADLIESKTEYETLKETVKSGEEENESNEAAIDKTKALIDKIGSYIIEFTTKRNQASELLKLYDSGGSCPVCYQDVKGIDIGPVNETIEDLDTKIKKLTERRNETRVEQQQLIQTKALYEAQISKLSNVNMKLTQGVSKIKGLQAELTRIESLDSTDTFKDEINKIRVELNTLLKDNAKIISEKYTRGIITELFKEDGIKSVIISKYIPYFNNRVRHYLQIMEADYEFTIDESFNETIRSRGREEFSYNSFSQGEKTRIDIALLFTWRDVAEQVSGTKISMLIMDEVFDSALDHSGIEAIHEIIDNMDGVQTYIISHRDQDINVYDRIIRTSKKGSFSKIDIEDLTQTNKLPSLA